MAHDIFISHASPDKAVADAICAALETRRIRCWIAPRDVLPGAIWGEAIVRAIAECRAMVLVFSSHANESTYTRKEVERAVDKGKIIVPFRIEDVMPSGAMEFSLSGTHWLDALTPPLERRISDLVESLGNLLGRDAALPAHPAATGSLAVGGVAEPRAHFGEIRVQPGCDVPEMERPQPSNWAERESALVAAWAVRLETDSSYQIKCTIQELAAWEEFECVLYMRTAGVSGGGGEWKRMVNAKGVRAPIEAPIQFAPRGEQWLVTVWGKRWAAADISWQPLVPTGRPLRARAALVLAFSDEIPSQDDRTISACHVALAAIPRQLG